MSDIPEFSWLRKNHEKIHYFGLGFIQLKISNETRLHFYTPELPPIVPEEDIHNHRYAFASRILKGEFTQEIFDIISGETHVMEKEDCKPGSTAVHDETPAGVGIKLVSRHTYAAGSNYFLSPEVFHRVSANECVTFLTRYGVHRPYADVVRPIGATKVCPFSQKVDEAKLWDIVERMLK